MVRSYSLAVPLAILAVVLLAIPGTLATRGVGNGVTASSQLTPSTPGTATVAFTLLPPYNLSSIFWGSTISPRALLLPHEADLVNATPIRTLVWPGAAAGDDYDPFYHGTAGGLWASNNTVTHAETNESEFVAWCRQIHCQAILQVPGEINNTTIAREIVNYTVSNVPVFINGTKYQGLNFRPAYWEVGNEPGLWANWNQAWGHRSRVAQNLTPNAYAEEVRTYTIAMDQADPTYTPPMIGLPGLGKGAYGGSGQWINATIDVNGPNLSGIALHVYPAAKYLPTGTMPAKPDLSLFYASQEGAVSMERRIYEEANVAKKACHNATAHPNCRGGLIPVFVTEFGSALSFDQFGNDSIRFPGALAETVEAIQGMNFTGTSFANMDLFGTVFNTSNSLLGLKGVPRPSYIVYSQILSHLGSEAFSVNVATNRSDVTNLSAVATLTPSGSGNRHDFLVVNTNVTAGGAFSTGFLNSSNGSLSAPTRAAAFPSGAPVEVWEWNATNVTLPANCGNPVNHTLFSCPYFTSDSATPAPVPVYFPNGLPPNWTVPPQSLDLFETYGGPAYPVQFTESGLNLAQSGPTPFWSLNIGGTETSSYATNLTLLLSPGTYTSVGVPIYLPPVGTNPKEREEPFLPRATTVTSGPQTVTVKFAQQWALNISWDQGRGNVTAVSAGNGTPPTWWNTSTPLSLQARPLPGYALTVWSGEGIGHFSGYSLNPTFAPRGPVEEQAKFVNNVSAVVFAEKGLPAGTPWNVSLRGLQTSTTGSQTTFYEINGTWNYQFSNVTGYQFNWWDRTAHVNGAPAYYQANYTALTPPFERYNVTFVESGLPVGTPWSMTFAGAAIGPITTSTLVLNSTNGSRGLLIPNVYLPDGTGYRPVRNASEATVVVNGAPETVAIVFERLFAIDFTESGLPSGITWSATAAPNTVVQATGSSSSDTIVLLVPNGTWGYQVPNVIIPGGYGYGFIRTPGGAVVNGTNASVAITFEPLYPVVFAEVGLPVSVPWHVTARYGSGTVSGQNTSPASITLSEFNGSYGFDAWATGNSSFNWEAVSALNFTVLHSSVTVTVVFRPGYRILFEESGLGDRVGSHQVLNWTVLGPGLNSTTDGAWTTAYLTNGSHTFTVPGVQDYVAISPRPETVLVQGAAVTVAVLFVRATVPVTFEVSGLPGGASYHIRLSTLNETAQAASLGFQIPNGTYSFDVMAPATYFASPSHGNVTVKGGAPVVTIAFLPVGRGPNPPFWTLFIPAATTAVVLGLSGLGGFALMGAVRRRRTGAVL
ncbi:MAG: hypothetical protein L3K10_07110 [Thermoplasmata archaeon]|nr:hypothetical protein [Thermoplasmata archaeon]